MSCDTGKAIFTIRKAVAADAEAAWAIRSAAIRSRCAGYYVAGTVQAWTSGAMSPAFVADVTANFHVATIDGRVVGTAAVELETGKVDAVFVDPDFIGRGIGRGLMSYLVARACEAGVALLTLDATLNAAAFYRACGFVGERVSTYPSPRGFTIDCIPMRMTLDDLSGRRLAD